MVIYLQCSKQGYAQNQNITINKTNSCQIPNKKFSKGKLYFELTHYEGNCYYLVGFKTSKGFAAFYPAGNLGKTKFWFEKKFGAGGNTSSIFVPTLSLSYGYTIGIGADFDASEIFVFHENFYFSHNFTRQEPGSKFEFYLFPANYELASDVVSINLGALPFKYKIPGFQLIGSNMNFSCKRKNQKNITFLFLEIILLITN